MNLTHLLHVERRLQVAETTLPTLKTYSYRGVFCAKFFFQYVSRNYNLVLNCLNSRTFYSRRHIYASFLINTFKGKINCHFTMDSSGIRVSKGRIMKYLLALRHSPPARSSIAENYICRLLEILYQKSLLPPPSMTLFLYEKIV